MDNITPFIYIKLEDQKVNSTIIMSLNNAKIEYFLNLLSVPEIFLQQKEKQGEAKLFNIFCTFCMDKPLRRW
jgi:hypothetical protein